MNSLSQYILEKFKISKDIKNINSIEDKYSDGDICLKLSLYKVHDIKSISISLGKIFALDFENGKMRMSSASIYEFEINRGLNEPDFGKNYRYNFRDIKKYNYIYLKKELQVYDDVILIPSNKAIEVLNKIVKNNTLNLHDFINTMDNEEIPVEIYDGKNYKEYSKKVLDFYIDYFKRIK